MRFIHSTNGPDVETEWSEYSKYLESIKTKISGELYTFAQLNLHDSPIQKILTPRKETVTVFLGEPAYEDIKSIIFTVEGVYKSYFPQNLIGQTIYAHEVSLSDFAAFEIRALLVPSELLIRGTSFTMEIEQYAPPMAGDES